MIFDGYVTVYRRVMLWTSRSSSNDHGTCEVHPGTPHHCTITCRAAKHSATMAGRWKKMGENDHLLQSAHGKNMEKKDIYELFWASWISMSYDISHFSQGQGQTRIQKQKDEATHKHRAMLVSPMFHLFFDRWHQFISIPHGKFAICSVDGFTHQKPRRWTKIHEQGRNAHNSFKMFQDPHLVD